jgi:Domain of unknown function (DUF4118)
MEAWDRMWMPIGVAGALVLGIALIPLREVTSASNLAFAFIAFTIVVAELGGRGAGLVTAVISAMSLNFFLTEPYLTLVISKVDDLIAFAGLSASGLIAAAFGSRRARWSEAAGRARKNLDVVQRLVEQIRSGIPLDHILSDVRRAYGLGALVLRAPDDRLLATALPPDSVAGVPGTSLAPETMLPAEPPGPRLGYRGVRVPEGGGRIRLPTHGGALALDLWEGDGAGLAADEWRTLSIVASILVLDLSRPTDRDWTR